MDKPVVLIADDNEATRTLIAALLQPDFLAETASDGGETIERLKSRRYAAILLDLRMPATDGYGVLDYLEKERPDLLPRVLVVTASLSRRELERVSAYKVHGVIAKPFDVDALAAAVRACATKNDPPLTGGSLMSSSMLFLIAEEVLRRVN